MIVDQDLEESANSSVRAEKYLNVCGSPARKAGAIDKQYLWNGMSRIPRNRAFCVP